MKPLEIAALFAAFTWYAGRQQASAEMQAAARQFARENWRRFLPAVDGGCGKLLYRVARPRPNSHKGFNAAA